MTSKNQSRRLFLGGAICAMLGIAVDTPIANGAEVSKGRIVFLGDSITAGYGLDPDQAYPALIQEKIDATGLSYQVVNAGVSGDTTAGGLRRVDWALGSGADLLVIALGGNDGLRGIPPAQTAENLTGIVTKARKKIPGLKVVIAGMRMPPNLGADFVAKFSAVFPEVAEKNETSLVPFMLEGVGGVANLNQADLIHPTAEGQKKIAEVMWPTIEKLLEKP